MSEGVLFEREILFYVKNCIGYFLNKYSGSELTRFKAFWFELTLQDVALVRSPMGVKFSTNMIWYGIGVFPASLRILAVSQQPLMNFCAKWLENLVIHHRTWQLWISYKLGKSHSMKVVMYSAMFQTRLTTLMKNKYWFA